MVEFITASNPYFGNIKPILESKKLIDVVFKKSMKAASTGNLGVTPVTKARRTESKRVLTCAKLFRDRLNEIVFTFPNFDEIAEFYLETIEIIFGLDKLKQLLGSISGTSNVIWRIYREHTSKIWHSSVYEAKKERKSAFSRFASVIYKMDKRFKELEDLRLQLKKLPVFNFEDPILVIAGFPNVGKSSFIKTLTNADPEVADYPFTTKKVSIGHFIDDINPFIKWQLVDTPGILDRPIKERNAIEKRTHAAIMSLPTLILFMFDPSQIDTLNQQFKLFSELKETTTVPILFLINKIDLISTEDLETLKEKIKSNVQIESFFLLQVTNKDISIDTLREVISNHLLNVVK